MPRAGGPVDVNKITACGKAKASGPTRGITSSLLYSANAKALVKVFRTFQRPIFVKHVMSENLPIFSHIKAAP